MTAQSLIETLEAQGITLWLDGETLRFRSHGQPLDDQLRARIKAQRADLTALIRRRAALRWPPPRHAGAGDRSGPLSNAQRQVWLKARELQDGTYNLAGAFRLTGPLDTNDLHRAIGLLIARHASLRTCFTDRSGVPAQHILTVASAHVEMHDLSAEPSAEQTWRDACARLAAQPIPMDHAPLFRVHLFRLSQDLHGLLVVVHHLIADGMSLSLLMDDLARLYRSAGRTAPPTDLQGPDMLDYARFEAALLADGDLAKARAYLQRVLEQGGELARLPPPQRAGAGPVAQGAALGVPIGPALAAGLRDLARDCRASLFMVVAAAIAETLGEFTGQSDLVLGMPVARRDRPALDRLVGLLLDMVPIRIVLDGASDFPGLVGRMKTAVFDAIEACTAPPDELTVRRPPFFNVVLTDFRTPSAAPNLEGLDVEPVDVRQSGAKFDLNFIVQDQGDGLRIDIEYDRAALDPVDAVHMRRHLLKTLARHTGVPDLPRDATDARPTGLFNRILDMAQERGDANALCLGDKQITYRALAERARHVALCLRGRGLGPGSVVALELPRGIDMVTAMLGVLGSGAAYLVCDPAWPEARKKGILLDAGADLLIAPKTDHSRRRLCLADLLAGAAAPGLPADDPDLPAYLMYTSGSTGTPKGVMIRQASVLELLDSTAPRFGFGPADTWTFAHNGYFDFSVWEIFGCLLTGGRLVIVAEDIARDPLRLLELVAAERITVMNLTPSLFQALIDRGAEAPGRLHGLRLVIFGGETLAPRLVERWFAEIGGGAHLVNMYGITEVTVHATWHWISPGPQAPESEIGSAIPCARVHVLGPDGTPAEDRCVGEICVGGTGVAIGYLGNPRETAVRFVPDPFAAQPGARMYRSGDFGRRSGAGLRYLGRRDGQVQLNGIRVDLGEIEAALTGLPQVQSAAAALDTDAAGQGLVAAVVPHVPGGTDPAALRGALRRILPVALVPRRIVETPALPVTPNGKRDRAAVAALCRSAPTGAPPIEDPPQSEMEQAVLALFREVLQDPSITATADFFEHGGDSMRAIRLASLAHERALPITVETLYAYPAIRDLAARVTGHDQQPQVAPPAPFSLVPDLRGSLPERVIDAYPMSALQCGMVYLRELAPETAVYHIVLSYRVAGRMQPSALRDAAQWVTDRHPILRTGFEMGHPVGPLQMVHTGIAAPVGFVDLRDLAGEEQERRLAEIIADERAAKFDIRRAPLFRLVVATLSDEAYQVIFSHHHLILDGWSVNVFFEDLLAAYQRLLSGERRLTDPKPDGLCATYVALEQAAQADPAARAFWNARVATGKGVLAPDRPSAPAMRQVRFEMPRDRYDALSALAAAKGSSVKTLLMAVHLRVLTWLFGEDEVVTGQVTACRPERHDAERALGLFLNEYPVRIGLAGKTWADLMRVLQAEEQAVVPHRFYPHAQIQEAHGPKPIFDTYFNFTNFHTTRELVTTQQLTILDVAEFEATHYTLGANYTVDVRHGGLRLILEYDANAIPAELARTIAGAHDRLLAAILDDPDALCLASPVPAVLDLLHQAPAARPVDAPPSTDVSTKPPLSREPAPEALCRRVEAVWREVLGCEHVDRAANFLDIGGSSLSAMRVVSRLRVTCGPISMETFLRAPTISAIAAHFAQAGGLATDAVRPAPRAGPGGGPGRYPLTAAQRQFWTLANALPGLPLFAMPGALEISGPLSLPRLAAALQRLVARHDALRTRFETGEEGPVQIVEPAARLDLASLDVADQADPDAACDADLRRCVLTPIELDTAPLARARIYRLAPERHVLFLTIHHIVCDGWSVTRLLDDLAKFYGALSDEGQSNGDHHPPSDVPHWTAAVTDPAGSAEATAGLDHWCRRLAPPWPSLSQPDAAFAFRAPGHLADRFRSDHVRMVLPGLSAQTLRQAARDLEMTEFMVAVMALAVTLRAWSTTTDIRIGTMMAARTDPAFEDVVGLLANTVVLRLSVDTGDVTDALVDHVRRTCVEALERQHIPFESVLGALHERHPEAGAEGLFEVMLLMQDPPHPVAVTSDVTWAPIRPKGGGLRVPLAPTTSAMVLALTPAEDALALDLQFATWALSKAEAEQLLADVAAALQGIVAARPGRT